MLRSETRYFPKGTIIADSSEDSKGLMVITSGQVELSFFWDSVKKMIFQVIRNVKIAITCCIYAAYLY